jgi:hypothetical protein
VPENPGDRLTTPLRMLFAHSPVMTSGASPSSYDTPTDFEAFVAHERGVGREQAAELIVRWLESYEEETEGPRTRRPSELLAAIY